MPEYTGFTLFHRDPAKKRHPKAPDYGGDGTLDASVIDYIIAETQAGRSPKLDISGWVKTSARGTRFISIKIGIPYGQSAPRDPGDRPAPQRSAFRAPSNTNQRDLDDDIPF